jgi:hypothetical protein
VLHTEPERCADARFGKVTTSRVLNFVLSEHFGQKESTSSVPPPRVPCTPVPRSCAAPPMQGGGAQNGLSGQALEVRKSGDVQPCC